MLKLFNINPSNLKTIKDHFKALSSEIIMGTYLPLKKNQKIKEDSV